MELNGIRDYQGFREQFNHEEQFESWMENWASHRLIKPYVKFAYRSESGRYMVDTLPLQNIFVAYPVAEIARMTKNARDNNMQEFSLLLRNLSKEHFEDLKKLIAIKRKPKKSV